MTDFDLLPASKQQPASPPAVSVGAPGVREPPRRLGLAGALLGMVLILALLAGFIFYRLETLPGRAASAGADRLEHWAAAVRDAIAAVARVHPAVTVNEHVVFEQTSPVLELAVVRQPVEVEREVTKTWLGSTKRLRLRGLYEAKAGFDLRKPFVVRLERDAAGKETVKIELPPARLLSLEQKRLEVAEFQNGLWNRIQPEELEVELNALTMEARLKTVSGNLLPEAEAKLAGQLREKLGPGRQVEISIVKPRAPAAESSPGRPDGKPR